MRSMRARKEHDHDVIINMLWAVTVIAASVGVGVLATWLVSAFRHRDEHYEQNYHGGRQ
jgi:heme/copper-type cytochrome/quinol oxidase subunit 2